MGCIRRTEEQGQVIMSNETKDNTMTKLETLAAQYAAEELREAEFRADQLEYELWDLRAAKYTADEKKDLLDKGKAIANANGDPSYPVADVDDIEKAVKAVGRGGADHDAIRLHIIKGAIALGPDAEALIPDNWDRSDGSLKDADTTTTTSSTVNDPEERAVNAYIDLTTAETVRSTHDAGYRTLPEPDDIDYAELRAVRTEIIEPLYVFLMSLSDEERLTKWAGYPPELRDALISYGDIEDAVEDALQRKLGDSDGDFDIYVCDAGEGWAVFRSYVEPPGMGLFKVEYDQDNDGCITFTSEAAPVTQVTTYEPCAAPDAGPLTGTTAQVAGPAGRSAVTLDDLDNDLVEIRTGRKVEAPETPEVRTDGVVTIDDLDADLKVIRNRKS